MKSPFLVAAPAVAAVLLATSGCTSPAESNSHKVAGGAVTRFHQLDTNGDGKVTFAEFNAGFAGTVFSQYNRDLNGSISLAEWDAVEQANTNKSISSFKLLDRNHDGKLTKDELTHGKRRDMVVRRLFNRIDTNHDGVITEQEAQAFGIERASDRDPANHP